MAIDPQAIRKARDKLRIAEKAISEMEIAKNHQELSDQWFIFLCAFKVIYAAFEQGSKSSPQDRQWFGSKKNIRRTDSLLQYVFQSRNDENHGLNDVTEFNAGGTAIGVSKPGFSSRLQINHLEINNGEIRGSIQSLDGKPILIKHMHPPYGIMHCIWSGIRYIQSTQNAFREDIR